MQKVVSQKVGEILFFPLIPIHADSKSDRISITDDVAALSVGFK